MELEDLKIGWKLDKSGAGKRNILQMIHSRSDGDQEAVFSEALEENINAFTCSLSSFSFFKSNMVPNT